MGKFNQKDYRLTVYTNKYKMITIKHDTVPALFLPASLHIIP